MPKTVKCLGLMIRRPASMMNSKHGILSSVIPDGREIITYGHDFKVSKDKWIPLRIINQSTAET